MKRIIILMILFLPLMAYAEPYDDVKPVMAELITHYNALKAGLDKAQNADHVVSALNNFVQIINQLKPEMAYLDARYPELKGLLIIDPPAKLLSMTNELKDARSNCLTTVQKKTAEYEDPEVQEARNNFIEATKTPYL